MTRRIALAVCCLLLPSLLVSVAPAASAATSPPEGLTTAGASTSAIPTLSWDRVPEATDYTVQVSATSTFTSVLWSATTVNLHAVPTRQLPSGALWFRVRANAPAGASDWSSRSFSRDQSAGPALQSPADGEPLSPPSEPILLSWNSSPGAVEYEVEISSSAGFVDPALSDFYKTETTSLVRPDPEPARTYYWRVRGILDSGITTRWSTARSYVLESLPAAVRVAPTEGETVDDIVLDWQPVAGATSYDVEISLVPDFSTIVDSQQRVLGTRYSPPVTLDNNQYYWRVRARDVSDNPQSTDEVGVWMFRRAWADQPSLEYPADGSAVGDPFYFQWTPVRLASSYVLQLTPNPRTGTGSCAVETDQTTWTPTKSDECFPRAGNRYSWKVIALDDPGNVQTDPVDAEVHTFDYLPGLVTPVSPAYDPAETPTPTVPLVTEPTVSWEPHAGAASYRVEITNVATGSSTSGTSYTTSWTPDDELATGTYRWSVHWISADGREGVVPDFDDQWRFEIGTPPVATSPTPDPITAPATYGRFPTLEWERVVNAGREADRYELQFKVTGGSTWTSVGRTFEYPEGQDASSDGVLPPGSYEWRVLAYDGSIYLSTGAIQQFTIAPRAAVTGKRIAMLGSESDVPGSSCTLTVPAICENVSHTPVLRWDAEPDTATYLLYLSYDRELTNLVGKNDGYPVRYPIAVNNTAYTPPHALQDSEAGTPYFWTVVPCVRIGPDRGCRSLEYPENSFSKLSARVSPQAEDARGVASSGVALDSLAPGDPVPTFADDVTLAWEDYLQTNTARPAPGNGLVSSSRTEARQYRVQVSTDPQFDVLLDNRLVDQPTFTSFDNTYPEGQVYWRVQALDGNRNALPWSRTWTFMKRSPVPTLIGPSGDGTPAFDGSTPLRWSPLNYAAAYDVEIYRNNDRKPDATNLVDSGTIAQTAVSWKNPVGPSTEAYTWRVRRVDAKNRRGGWSSWMSYVVRAQSVDLESPADVTTLAPRESLFSWAVTRGAAEYRWERRAPGAGTTASTVTTPATAYAPTAKLPDGTWEWRVVALDAAGQQLGVSPWRTFTVRGAPRATTEPSIAGTGQVGSVLTSTAPEWDLTGVTDYYQWLRNGSAIPGATATSYEVTTADVGRTLSLRVTGRRPGYDDAVTTSNPIAGVSGPAPSTSQPPSVSGSGKVGSTLTGTAPSWNEPGVTMTYRWLRDGSPISNATSLTYVVGTADLGKDLSLQVVGKKSGYADATVFSNVIRAVAGDAPANTAPPEVTGDAEVGETLRTTAGTWDTTSLSYSYQWLRGGAPIEGATRSSYRLDALDAGREVSVVVTARKSGLADGRAESTALPVSRLSSTTSITLARKTIKKSARGQVVVIVDVDDLTPVGKVRVSRGRKVIATGRLTEARDGTVKVRLPRLGKGKHRLTASFPGTDQIAASRSRKVVLKVR